MATSPMHIGDTAEPAGRKAGEKAGKPPITANPAFPWIVALWFASLLGVGSLIVPTYLLDKVSAATGIAAIFPMAAPPLGFTAKGLLALAGVLGGGWLGLFLARRIAASQSRPAANATPRKVLNPADDIGDDDFDEDDDHDDLPSPMLARSRRRALAMEEESGPSDYLTVTRLPGVHGGTDHLLTVSDDIVEDAVIEDFVDESGVEPLELDESIALDEFDDGLPVGGSVEAEVPEERQEFIPAADRQEPAIVVNYAEPVRSKATAAEPLPFSPPSMARAEEASALSASAAGLAAEPNTHPEETAGPESEDTVSDNSFFPSADLPESGIPDPEAPFDAQPDATDGSAENDAAGEGLVQLVQRLGSTLEKHREWVASNAARKAAAAPVKDEGNHHEAEAHDAVDAPVPDEFDPAGAEDVSQAMAAYFGGPSVAAPDEPVAGRDVEVPGLAAATTAAAPGEEPRQRYESFRGTIGAMEFEEDDEDDIVDLAASFTLPRLEAEKPVPTPRPAFDQPPPSARIDVADEEVEDDTAFEEETGNVASLPTSPFRRNAEQFVRIEEPEPEDGDAEPAVMFPNQSRKTASTASAPVPFPAPAPRAFDPPAAQEQTAPPQVERPRPSNDDNDRALREALLNLQRMGK